MTPTITRTLLTADDFLASDHSGYELVNGIPEALNVGSLSSWLGGEIAFLIGVFIRAGKLGMVFPQETAIAIWPGDPTLVRKPDVMFVRAGKIQDLDTAYVTVVPDLIVEVVSPNDTAERLELKLHEYRRAGVPLIWVIHPEPETAYEYRLGQPGVEKTGTLDAAPVLPGFVLDLTALFASARNLPQPRPEAESASSTDN